jgi:hypothetical protein
VRDKIREIDVMNIDSDGIPFDKYNDETMQAINDAHNGIGLSAPYNSVAELSEALHADDKIKAYNRTTG